VIKRTDPKAIFKFISVQDPAIDEEASDLKAYGTSFDLTHLKFKTGMTPTVFLAKNLTAPEKAEINDAHYQFTQGEKPGEPPKIKVVKQGLMMVRYFETAVKSIEEDGKTVAVSVDEFPAAVVQEIGAYVMRRASVEEDEKK